MTKVRRIRTVVRLGKRAEAVVSPLSISNLPASLTIGSTATTVGETISIGTFAAATAFASFAAAASYNY